MTGSKAEAITLERVALPRRGGRPHSPEVEKTAIPRRGGRPHRPDVEKAALSRRGGRLDDDCVEDGDLAIVRFGNGLAIVETTFSRSHCVTKTWLKNLRPPLLVGLVALRGSAPGQANRTRYNPRDTRSPVRCIALCVGGSRALVYQPTCVNHKYTNGPLAFRDCKMSQVRALLGDGGVTVACVGAKEAAKKLKEEWGLHVQNPVELTDLFARAYGMMPSAEAPKKPRKYWNLSSGAMARAQAKARAQFEAEKIEAVHGQGKSIADQQRRLPMELMARTALGCKMKVWPPKVANADWEGDHLGEDEWMYATRDAYLSFEVARRCLRRLGI